MTKEQENQFRSQLREIADCFESIASRKGRPVSHSACFPAEWMIKKQEESELLLLSFSPKKPCLYSVGVGRHAYFAQDKGRPFDWHIALFYPVMQKSAGGGRNLQQAVSILREVERKRPDFFTVRPGDSLPNGYAWSYLNVFKRYYLKDSPCVNPQIIADDLAWLIDETHDQFKALPK